MKDRPAWGPGEGPYISRVKAAIAAAAATANVPVADFVVSLDKDTMTAPMVDKLIRAGGGPDLSNVIRTDVPAWIVRKQDDRGEEPNEPMRARTGT